MGFRDYFVFMRRHLSDPAMAGNWFLADEIQYTKLRDGFVKYWKAHNGLVSGSSGGIDHYEEIPSKLYVPNLSISR